MVRRKDRSPAPSPGRTGAALRGALTVAVQMLVVSVLLSGVWVAIVVAGGPEQPLVPQLLWWALATSLSSRPVVALINAGSPRGRPVLRLVLLGVMCAFGVASSALPFLYPVIIAGSSLITLPRHPGLRTEAAAAAVVLAGSAALEAGVRVGLVPTDLPQAAGTTLCGGLVLAALVFLRYAGALSSELAASHAALAREQSLRVEELHRASTHDPLTGLLNRAGLDEAAPAALAAAGPGRNLGLLYLDLDSFKPVNDTYGHAAGDALLAVVAERLRDAVRIGDEVARVGGDEFVVLMPDVPDEATLQEVVRRAVGVICDPVELPGGGTVTVGASVGWALADDPGVMWESLVARADQAMYGVKEARPRAATGRPDHVMR